VRVVRDSIGDDIGIGVESFFFVTRFWWRLRVGAWWGLVNVISDNDIRQNI
jgi:hypothetical protein